MQKSIDWADEFSASAEDGLVDVYIYWGLKQSPDRTGTDFYDPTDFGTVRYNGIDLSDPQNQL